MVIDGAKGLALLADANPIPDPDKVDTAFEAGAFVAESPTGGSSKRPSTRSWLVAVTVVSVVFGVALAFTARDSSPADVTGTTWIEGVDEWLQIPYEKYDGLAGTYRTRFFPVGFSYEIPGDWHSHDLPEVVHLLPDKSEKNARETGETGETGALVDFIHVSSEDHETVDGWIEELLEIEGIHLTELVDTELGGAQGKTFQVWAIGDQVAVIDGNDPEDPDDDWTIPPKPGYLTYVVGVGYETVVITVIPDQTGSDFHELAIPIIESIQWRDLN